MLSFINWCVTHQRNAPKVCSQLPFKTRAEENETEDALVQPCAEVDSLCSQLHTHGKGGALKRRASPSVWRTSGAAAQVLHGGERGTRKEKQPPTPGYRELLLPKGVTGAQRSPATDNGPQKGTIFSNLQYYSLCTQHILLSHFNLHYVLNINHFISNLVRNLINLNLLNMNKTKSLLNIFSVLKWKSNV